MIDAPFHCPETTDGFLLGFKLALMWGTRALHLKPTISGTTIDRNGDIQLLV